MNILHNLDLLDIMVHLWRMVVTFLATCLQVLPIKEWIAGRSKHGEIADYVIRINNELQRKNVEAEAQIKNQKKEISELKCCAVIVTFALLLKICLLENKIKDLNESLTTQVCFCPDYEEEY